MKFYAMNMKLEGENLCLYVPKW